MRFKRVVNCGLVSYQCYSDDDQFGYLLVDSKIDVRVARIDEPYAKDDKRCPSKYQVNFVRGMASGYASVLIEIVGKITELTNEHDKSYRHFIHCS